MKNWKKRNKKKKWLFPKKKCHYFPRTTAQRQEYTNVLPCVFSLCKVVVSICRKELDNDRKRSFFAVGGQGVYESCTSVSRDRRICPLEEK